ncbi:hypothetical protein HanIR_Chr11g0505571 [Helianthus annuus]|nr:hypothetical protein HanIR_Chr11g0505571 [Helianthus annuus]
MGSSSACGREVRRVKTVWNGVFLFLNGSNFQVHTGLCYKMVQPVEPGCIGRLNRVTS